MGPAADGAGLRPDIERRILAIVGDLLRELGGATRAPALDHSLERDLGLSSLERVELLHRVERAFDLHLSDSAAAEVVTARDLAMAVRRAGPRQAGSLPARHEPHSPGTPAPASAATLVDVLAWHAEKTPDRVHIHLREDHGETPIRYGELATRAQGVAAGLRARGIARGDRVALMLRTEPAFFPAYLGTLMAGAVPVPLYPPVRPDQIEEYARRQQVILRSAGARVLITFAEVLRVARLLGGAAPALEHVVTIDDLHPDGTGAPADRAGSADPALIQYTSGSTGNPKGVLLSHANLLANIRAFGQALAVGPEDVAVSWLPLYHDMGLIGAWLGSLYHGVPLVLLSPLAFLSRPSQWLAALHTHGGTVSAAPNFAYDLAVHRITDEEIQGLNLRSWRLALNGAEAVRPETIERFTRRFAPFGFRTEAMCPVYGLAESSVALTASPLGRPPRVDAVAREPFEQRREVRAAAGDDPQPMQFVSCGQPLPEHEVRIVDEAARPLGTRVEGHVQFRGPSVTAGYFGNPDATRAVVHDGWMDSGDLGYRVDDELFITGRVKDVIIQAGRNISAQEVEEAAATAPGIRKGCIAAFGVHDPAVGTERFVVVAETRERDAARWAPLRTAVRERVAAAVGVPPDLVVITRPGAVLKTPSGKIRHSAVRDAYLNGTLGRRRSTAGQMLRLVAADVGARIGRTADRCRRMVFTAYVAAVVVATVPALWSYLLFCPAGRPADRAVRLWSRLILAACGMRPRVEGAEHLSGLGPAILAANHSSYIDVIVVMAAFSTDFRFVAKRRLGEYPVIGTIIRKVGHTTIEKATVADRLTGADDLAAPLRNGGKVFVFPEGTFVRTAGLLPFRLGAFKAAMDTGCPIVPIAIRGTRRALPDETWLFRRGPVEVIVGAPLVPTASGWDEMLRLRDETRATIARGSGETA